MRRVDFDELSIFKQYRNPSNNQYVAKVLAYDTETIKGKAVLICDSEGRHIYPQNFSDCIRFITPRIARREDVLSFWYNMDYDIDAILKYLSKEHIRKLAKSGELVLNLDDDSEVVLQRIDRKLFKIIRAGRHNYLFYDIRNFLPGGLDNNAEKYLGKRKLKIPVDFATDSDKKVMRFFKTAQGIEYCKRDAEITRDLAQMFIDSVNRFGIFTRNFCSSASIATHYFQTQCDIPTLLDITQGHALRSRYAYEAYKGGFIQCFKKGYFDRVYVYDINSAYPYQLSKLPNLKHGKMIGRPKGIPKGAYMGWMRVTVRTIDRAPYAPCYFSPLPVYVKKMNKNFYLAGKIKTTITLAEYHALKNDFDIQVHQGVYWMPDKIEYMYKDSINYIYQLRKKTKDKNLNLVLKTILNGYYGKLIQKIPMVDSRGVAKDFKTGNLFNPFHASYITAMTRLQLYELIKKHGAYDLIAVMTDAVAFEKDPQIKTGTALGQWSLEFDGEGVFIGSGLYSLKKGDTVKTATRGFKMTQKLDFFRLCAENLTSDIIPLPQQVRLTYREALRVKKFLDWNVIGKSIKRININCDNKRNWTRDFKNCEDVLKNMVDSAPIFVNM